MRERYRKEKREILIKQENDKEERNVETKMAQWKTTCNTKLIWTN